jgi:hypothetical protein
MALQEEMGISLETGGRRLCVLYGAAGRGTGHDGAGIVRWLGLPVGASLFTQASPEWLAEQTGVRGERKEMTTLDKPVLPVSRVHCEGVKGRGGTVTGPGSSSEFSHAAGQVRSEESL